MQELIDIPVGNTGLAKSTPSNLRTLLTELGHRLVHEHGFQPANLHGCSAFINHTLEPLVRFLVWLEHTPQAHFVLQQMGVWRTDHCTPQPPWLDLQEQGRNGHEPGNGKHREPGRARS